MKLENVDKLLDAMQLVDVDNNPGDFADAHRRAFLKGQTTEAQRREMEVSLGRCSEEELATLAHGKSEGWTLL
jgi:hypothetical protein